MHIPQESIEAREGSLSCFTSMTTDSKTNTVSLA